MGFSAHANWPALQLYFSSLEDDCPRQICILLKISTDGAGVQDKETVMLWRFIFFFCNKILSLFKDVVQKLEANGTTCVELKSIMHFFRAKLTQRREDQFFVQLMPTRQRKN